MPTPSTGFDLGYLITQGEIKVDDPVSRHFPEGISVAMSGKTATLTFEGRIGESYTVDWGDGQRQAIVSSKTGATHTYATEGDYEVCLWEYGTKNWEIEEEVTAAAPAPVVVGTWDVTEDGAATNGCCDITGSTLFNLTDKTGGVHTVAEFNGFTAMTISTPTFTRVYTDVTASALGAMAVLAGTAESETGTPSVGQVATITRPA